MKNNMNINIGKIRRGIKYALAGWFLIITLEHSKLDEPIIKKI